MSDLEKRGAAAGRNMDGDAYLGVDGMPAGPSRLTDAPNPRPASPIHTHPTQRLLLSKG